MTYTISVIFAISGKVHGFPGIMVMVNAFVPALAVGQEVADYRVCHADKFGTSGKCCRDLS